MILARVTVVDLWSKQEQGCKSVLYPGETVVLGPTITVNCVNQNLKIYINIIFIFFPGVYTQVGYYTNWIIDNGASDRVPSSIMLTLFCLIMSILVIVKQ